MEQRLEQEDKLDELFNDIQQCFSRIEKAKDGSRQQEEMKTATNKIKECKNLIKEFEREARTDGIPAEELQAKKRWMVNELNRFIALKKQLTQQMESRKDLLGSGSPVDTQEPLVQRGTEGMTQQELMQEGRRKIGETDQGLNRVEKLVNDTEVVGTEINKTLADQTKQMEGIVDNLNEIEFTMKTAAKSLRNITRGILTDRCIQMLLCLVVIGVIAIIVVRVVRNPDEEVIPFGGDGDGEQQQQNRKLLTLTHEAVRHW